MMPEITWVLLVLIGFIAGVSGKDARSGALGSIVIGIAGALVGGKILDWLGLTGYVLRRLGLSDYGLVVSLVMAAAGAVMFLYVARLITES